MFDTNALEQIKRIPQTNTTTTKSIHKNHHPNENPTTKSTKKK
jgi:hypothetical protein